jgi:transposase-like protein
MTKRVKLDDDEPVNVGGRPTKYKPEYVRTVQFLAQGGATQDEIAECLGISRMTVIRWSVQHPEFGAAIQAGNDVFNRRVERALAERAIGFYADQFTWRETTERERKQGKPEYELVPTGRTYYPPDVTAGIYWSKNRMKDKWSDVSKVEVQGKLKSSDELLQDFNTKLLKLQEQGYLKGLKVYGLPEPEDSNDTEAE